MTPCDTKSVADWLKAGARSAPEPQQVLAELCDRLCVCGVPLWRADVFVRTLHPQVIGRRFRWQAGADVSISVSKYDLPSAAESRKSLVEHVCADGSSIRIRLTEVESPREFPLLGELQAEGATDLLASPLVFTDGDVHAAVWITQQPGGFAVDIQKQLMQRSGFRICAVLPPFQINYRRRA